MGTKKEEAKRILSNTAPEKAFWINNGPILKNIIDLAVAAKKITPQQFAHHVSQGKNDFAKWVDEVIRDQALAKKLQHAKTKEELSKAATGRLKALQRLLK